MRKILCGVSSAALAAAGALVVATPVHAATGAQVCVVNVDNYAASCGVALSGFVVGIPAALPSSGPTAAQISSMSSNPSNAIILGVAFQNADYTGNAVVFISNHPSTYCGSIASTPATVNINQVDGQLGATAQFHYDNALNSEFALNGCSVGGAADPGYSGFQAGLQAVDYHPSGTGLYNQISSIRFGHTPTQTEALTACAHGAATCNTVATGMGASLGPATLVDTVANCSGMTQSKTDTWTHTYTTTQTVGGSFQSDTSFEAEVADWIKVSEKVSIQANWSKALTDTQTYTESVPINVADGTYGYLLNAPQTETFTGYMNIWINNSQAYIQVPWSWSQAVPPSDLSATTSGYTGTTTFSSAQMTPAEYSACKKLPSTSALHLQSLPNTPAH